MHQKENPEMMHQQQVFKLQVKALINPQENKKNPVKKYSSVSVQPV